MYAQDSQIKLSHVDSVLFRARRSPDRIHARPARPHWQWGTAFVKGRILVNGFLNELEPVEKGSSSDESLVCWYSSLPTREREPPIFKPIAIVAKGGREG